MSYIYELKLNNIRSHTNIKLELDPLMNAVVGPNGSGKTTIIESIYTLLRGTSFKGSLKELLQENKQQYSTELIIKTDKTTHSRSLKYQNQNSVITKKWSIDSKNYARLPVKERLPVVLFEPDLARLITGGPERRRLYLDKIASELDIEVASAQQKYERLLKQRNQLLKQLRGGNNYKSSEQMFIWNTQLAHASEVIIQARFKVLESLKKQISKFYKQLGGTDKIDLIYQSQTAVDPAKYASTLLNQFESLYSQDILLGYTSFGPHRDDVLIKLGPQPAIERASRGEVRTIVVAFKLLETKLLATANSAYNMPPTLLLDDVLSELDLKHQEHVLEGLKGHQVLITTTDAHALKAGMHTIFLE